jgi:hypothetical protein
MRAYSGLQKERRKEKKYTQGKYDGRVLPFKLMSLSFFLSLTLPSIPFIITS